MNLTEVSVEDLNIGDIVPMIKGYSPGKGEPVWDHEEKVTFIEKLPQMYRVYLESEHWDIEEGFKVAILVEEVEG